MYIYKRKEVTEKDTREKIIVGQLRSDKYAIMIEWANVNDMHSWILTETSINITANENFILEEIHTEINPNGNT